MGTLDLANTSVFVDFDGIADVVFAKGALAGWCEQLDVPNERFATLAAVTARVR